VQVFAYQCPACKATGSAKAARPGISGVVAFNCKCCGEAITAQVMPDLGRTGRIKTYDFEDEDEEQFEAALRVRDRIRNRLRNNMAETEQLIAREESASTSEPTETWLGPVSKPEPRVTWEEARLPLSRYYPTDEEAKGENELAWEESLTGLA
jgi:hypothetical protein